MDIRIIISDGTGTRKGLDFSEKSVNIVEREITDDMDFSSNPDRLPMNVYIGGFTFPMEDVVYLSVEEKK